MPNCFACAHSFMEPDDDLVCGHPEAGHWGLYAFVARFPDQHCGPAGKKFEQHPMRNEDGTLKSSGEMKAT